MSSTRLSVKSDRHHQNCQHNRYQLDCAEFDELYGRSGGKCEICFTPEQETPHQLLHIDHNDRLGPWAVRGLLCSRCNTLLGRPGLLSEEVAGRYLGSPWRSSPPKASQPTLAEDPADPNLYHPSQTEFLSAVVAQFDHAGAVIEARKGARLRQRNASIRQAHADGWRPVDIQRVTGLSRETIRQALREV